MRTLQLLDFFVFVPESEGRGIMTGHSRARLGGLCCHSVLECLSWEKVEVEVGREIEIALVLALEGDRETRGGGGGIVTYLWHLLAE